MSLLSNKLVNLTVGNREARASLHSGWFRGKVLASSHHLVDQADSVSATSGEPESQIACIKWVRAALSELTSSSDLTNGSLRVQISDALTHFDVVPGDFTESSERQLQAIALACMDDLLGDRSGPQTVRWQLQDDARHLLIASLQTAAVDALAIEAARYEMSLDTLQPEFCARWNAHAHALSGKAAVFASEAEGAVVMALVEHGSITALSIGALGDDGGTVPLDGIPKTALDLRADRLAATQGVDPASLSSFVVVASREAQLATSARWTVMGQQEKSA